MSGLKRIARGPRTQLKGQGLEVDPTYVPAPEGKETQHFQGTPSGSDERSL